MARKQVKRYRLLKDMPYYANPGAASIGGWLGEGYVVTVTEQVRVGNEDWICHSSGWTLARRGERCYVKQEEEIEGSDD